MRVGVNLLWLVPGVVGGTEGHATGLLRALAAEGSTEVVLFALPGFAEAHPDLAERFLTVVPPLPAGRHVLRRVTVESTWLAWQLRRRRLDVVHHLGGLLPAGAIGPSVVTVHDLQYRHHPEYFSRTKLAFLNAATGPSMRRADVVATPSEFTRQDVLASFRLDPDFVRVTPAALAAPVSCDPDEVTRVRRELGLPKRWVIYPAATYPHKNHELLLRAFARVAGEVHDVALVFTGARGAGAWGSAGTTLESLRHLAETLGISERVVVPGYLDRDTYGAAVAGAAAMTFPSTFEGYGLPVVEAMAAGVPLLASNATALPELTGTIDPGGWLLPPHDVQAWEEALRAVLSSDSERRRWSDAGRRRYELLAASSPVTSLLSAYRLAARSR